MVKINSNMFTKSHARKTQLLSWTHGSSLPELFEGPFVLCCLDSRYSVLRMANDRQDVIMIRRAVFLFFW